MSLEHKYFRTIFCKIFKFIEEWNKLESASIKTINSLSEAIQSFPMFDKISLNQVGSCFSGETQNSLVWGFSNNINVLLIRIKKSLENMSTICDEFEKIEADSWNFYTKNQSSIESAFKADYIERKKFESTPPNQRMKDSMHHKFLELQNIGSFLSTLQDIFVAFRNEQSRKFEIYQNFLRHPLIARIVSISKSETSHANRHPSSIKKDEDDSINLISEATETTKTDDNLENEFFGDPMALLISFKDPSFLKIDDYVAIVNKAEELFELDKKKKY